MNKESVKLDKKLQMYIATMALQLLPFGLKWDSSAEKLQGELYKRGIKLKLYYEYKLPGAKKPSEFMNQIAMDNFCNDFYSKYAGKVLKDKNLTMSEKLAIFKYVWSNRNKFKSKMDLYEKEVRKLNPELSNLKIGYTNSYYGIVYGAIFGFAPDDIEYFSNIQNRDFDEEAKYFKLFENKYGIKVNYVLAPDTVKKIITALEQHVQHNSKDR